MDYLDLLQRRVSLGLLQEHLSAAGMPTARSWDALKAKLQELSQQDAETNASIEADLLQYYRKTLTLGTRAVQVFAIDEAWATRLSRYFKSIEVNQGAYANSYPKPLSSKALSRVDPAPVLCEVLSDAKSTTLIFCGQRLVEEKDRRTPRQMGAAVKTFGWDQYDEFILIKRSHVQTFEVVRIDTESNFVELRTEEMPGVDTSVELEQLKGEINALIANRFGTEAQLVTPINLFPAIRPIYSAASEGHIVELGFTTATGSAKHEKMRGKKLDLRKERFHVGGKAAVKGNLTPFRVAIRWLTAGRTDAEEAILPGSIRQLSSSTPWLDHLVLKGCRTESEMRALLAKVLRYLPKS